MSTLNLGGTFQVGSKEKVKKNTQKGGWNKRANNKGVHNDPAMATC